MDSATITEQDCSFEGFGKRMAALMEEAESYGISSVAALIEDEPISRKEHRWTHGCGGQTLLLGLSQRLLDYHSQEEED